MLAGRGATSGMCHRHGVQAPLSAVLYLLTLRSGIQTQEAPVHPCLCLSNSIWFGFGLIGCAKQIAQSPQEARSPGQRYGPRVVQACPWTFPQPSFCVGKVLLLWLLLVGVQSCRWPGHSPGS